MNLDECLPELSDTRVPTTLITIRLSATNLEHEVRQQAHGECRVQLENLLCKLQNAEGAFLVPNPAAADIVVTITKLHPHTLLLQP